MKERPVLLLTVATSFGEVDWILPALVRFREENPDWRIITMFGHKLVYEIFRQGNSSLFREFEAVSDLNVVPQEMDSLFSDEIRPGDVRLILKDFNRDEFAPWKGELARRCPDALLLNYPHSCHIYSRAGHDRERECPDPADYSRHDYFLLGSENDIPHWSGLVAREKIRVVGYPRYDHWWIERLLNASEYLAARSRVKAMGNGPVFFHVSRGPHPHYLSEEDYRYLMTSFMDEAMIHEGSMVMIKPHPRQDISALLRLLEPYDQDRWTLTDLHLIQGAALADVVVSGWSSGILDSLAVGKPVIEFWRFGGRDPLCRRDENGRYTTIYRELGLAAPADSRQELAPLIGEALADPDGPRWRGQQDRFNKLCRKQADASGNLARFLAAVGGKEEKPPPVTVEGGDEELKRLMLARVERMGTEGDEAGALRWLSFLAGEFPGDREIERDLGVALFNTGDFPGAIDRLSSAMHEGDRGAAVSLVNILVLLDRDREAAEVAASTAISLDEDSRSGFLRELADELGPDLFDRVRRGIAEHLAAPAGGRDA